MAQITQHVHLESMIRASEAPERRLPGWGEEPRVASRGTFWLWVAMVAVVGLSPVLIAWVAAGLLFS